MRKSLFKMITLLIFSTAGANANDLESYGDLYLIEEKTEVSKRSYEVGLSTGLVSNHPMYSIDTLGLSARKRWNLNYRTGLRYLYNKVRENASTQLINSQLRKESKLIESNYPKHLLMAELDLLAFIGHLNFFEMKKISTNSGFGLEAGSTLGYEEQVLVLNPKYIIDFEVTKSLYAGFFVGQRFYMNRERESFTELGLNFNIRL